MGVIYLTRACKKRLVDELKQLQKKSIVQDEITRAKELGDLRGNAEYRFAKEMITSLILRIAELDSKITCSRIIEEQNINSDKMFIDVAS